MDPKTASSPAVDIVLATYNGAEFVAEQIESLFRQTYDNWRILARDDGSTDGTVAILERFARDFPDRFVLIADTDGNLGYASNFSRLLEHTTAGYLALCDQDDIWLPGKLAVCMERMWALERDNGPATPLLVHSDLKVVDRNLKEISPSFWDYRCLDPRTGNSLNRVLAQNVATGCATVFNRPLMDICAPIPEQAVAHDWWIALTAAAFGSTAYIAQPTVLYRQHAGNTIGAQSFQLRHLGARLVETLRGLREYQWQLRGTFVQARKLLDRYSDRLTTESSMLLKEFAALPKASRAMRIHYVLKWRIIPARRLYWLALALSL